MAPAIGLVLTHAPDLAWLHAQLARARATVLKVVPAWGLDGGWTPAAISAAATMAETLIVRTSWGDPSYNGGARAMPYANQVCDEVAPWLSARADAAIEIGNEPLLEATDEGYAWDYLTHLAASITAIRGRFPHAHLIAPAHQRDHLVRLGEHADGQRRWDAIAAPTYRRCDVLGLHAYSVTQAVSGLHALRDLVSGDMPIWLTEFGLFEDLADAARGARYADVLAALPIPVACLYHLDSADDRPTLAAQGPAQYRLSPATLQALGDASPPLGAAPAPAVAPAAHHPERIDDFLMDVWQWRTVGAFRRHLACYGYAQTAPWATGVTLHHSVSPLASTWRGVASVLSMAKFYRDDPEHGWDRGPHLFAVSGAPNPDHSGIWQMCPLSEPGIHAAAFNATHWGIEVIGSYDSQRWDAGTAALALGALAALHDWAGWRGVTTATLNGHRDDPKTTKTCPGKAVDLAAVRRGVAALRQGA
jgi:hypothetical protein